MQSVTHFVELPDDVVNNVLLLLLPKDITMFARVCKRFARLAQDDVLWESFCLRDCRDCYCPFPQSMPRRRLNLSYWCVFFLNIYRFLIKKRRHGVVQVLCCSRPRYFLNDFNRLAVRHRIIEVTACWGAGRCAVASVLNFTFCVATTTFKSALACLSRI